MQEIKKGCATIRVHGNVNPDIKSATTDFLKKVEQQRKRAQRNEKESTYQKE